MKKFAVIVIFAVFTAGCASSAAETVTPAEEETVATTATTRQYLNEYQLEKIRICQERTNQMIQSVNNQSRSYDEIRIMEEFVTHVMWETIRVAEQMVELCAQTTPIEVENLRTAIAKLEKKLNRPKAWG